MNSYKVLNKQIFSKGEFSLVPIRFEDRLDIMKWRNEQIYHLRQNKPLTEKDQTNYFENVVAPLFDEEKPTQILFSYLENGKCIGYGGLVHINWIDKNAEVSFIMDTNLEKEFFDFHWISFLKLIEQIAFKEMNLHKIFTYAFDLRPKLYNALKQSNFIHEATLKEHCKFGKIFIDVLIHSKINKINLRKATKSDIETTFEWSINPGVRKYSFNKNIISKDEHYSWFEQKLGSDSCLYLILEDVIKNEIGSIRIDFNKDNDGIISYLIDPYYHGRGYGKLLLTLLHDYILENSIFVKRLIGYVLPDNKASIKIFEDLNYTKSLEDYIYKFTKTFK